MKKIAVLAGDGIGPEVVNEAIRVLKKVSGEFSFKHALIGGAAWDKFGCHFPEETAEICWNSDAILFGSVGGPVSEAKLDKWRGCEANSILGLRKLFKFYANFRPVRVFRELAHLSPLSQRVIGDSGCDLLIIRELLGDIYFGEHRLYKKEGERNASDVAEYSESQIRDIAEVAFKAAQGRGRKVTSVDKANVLSTSKLWREIVEEVATSYPEVKFEHMLVDNCAMQLVLNPAQFDVILTANLFGDILSDVGAVLPGSLGLLASASLNKDGFGMFEPPGGSAPDIAGKGLANPTGQILSSAMLLRFSFGMEVEAAAIEAAVSKTLQAGYRTKDLDPEEFCSTSEFTDQVLKYL
jgi:3-isopropylmalate dehydrogenase